MLSFWDEDEDVNDEGDEDDDDVAAAADAVAAIAEAGSKEIDPRSTGDSAPPPQRGASWNVVVVK